MVARTWRGSFLAAVVLAACPAFAQNLIPNGSFSEGADLPSGWDPVSFETGRLVAQRDTKTFASAPAALRIDAASAPATGKVHCTIRAGAGEYRVRGKMKCREAVAGIAAIMFGPNGKQLGWNELAFSAGSSDFLDFDVRTHFVPGTETVVIAAFGDFRTSGALWVDDISHVICQFCLPMQ